MNRYLMPFDVAQDSVIRGRFAADVVLRLQAVHGNTDS